MNRIITIISVTLAANLLTGCSEDTKTVQWYVDHPEALAKEVEKCKIRTPAELATDKHCAVIRAAQEQAFYEQQRNAPSPNIEFK